MSDNKISEQVDKMKVLTEKLSRCSLVVRLNTMEDHEPSTLAHAFVDLEESFRKFVDELLPKLLSEELDEEEIRLILHDIGEEFRHILYHIKDPRYFDYLWRED